MALDVTQDDSAVIGALIDGVEQSLGTLLDKIHVACDASGASEDAASGSTPTVAAQHHGDEIRKVLNAARGLADELICLVDDGVLELTPMLDGLIADLLGLQMVATMLLEEFEPGMAITADSLDALDTLFTRFGELLQQARVSAGASNPDTVDTGQPCDVVPPVDTKSAGEPELTTSKAEGDGEPDSTDEAPEVVAGSDTEESSDEEEGDSTHAADSTATPDEDTGEMSGSDAPDEMDAQSADDDADGTDPSLFDVVKAGQDALDEIDAIIDLLLTLHFGDYDAENPQLLDDIDWIALRRDALEVLGDLRENLADALQSGDVSTVDMQAIIDEALAAVSNTANLIKAFQDLDGTPSEGATGDATPKADESAESESAKETAGADNQDESGADTQAEEESDVEHSDTAEEGSMTGDGAAKSAEDGADDGAEDEVRDADTAGTEPTPKTVADGDGKAGDNGHETEAETEVTRDADEGAPTDTAEEVEPADPEPKPTLADVVRRGQDALDDMDDLVDELLELHFEYYDTENPQLSDSIDWIALRNTIISKIKELRANLADGLQNGSLTTEELMGKIDDARKDLAVCRDMVDSVKMTMGGAVPDVPEAAGTEPTRAEIAAAAQAMLDRLGELSDDALAFFMEYADIDGVRLFDGVDWMDIKSSIDGDIDKLRKAVSAALTDPNADLGKIMTLIETIGFNSDDLRDFIDTMGRSIAGTDETAAEGAEGSGTEGNTAEESEGSSNGDASTATDESDPSGGDPEHVEGTRQADVTPPDRDDVVQGSEELFDLIEELGEELLELYFKGYNMNDPELADSFDWMTIKREIETLAQDVRDQVLPLLYGPDKDLDKAMSILSDAYKTVANYRNLVDSVGTFGVKQPEDSGEKTDWDDFQPETREDLTKAAQELLGYANILATLGMDRYLDYTDPNNPKLRDDAPWLAYREEALAIIDEIRNTMPGLLMGDNAAGGMTLAQIQEAATFLEGIKARLDDLSDRMEAWMALPTLAVDQGRVWGDPHFVGEDGGLYDVQGEAGKHYNILSDEGLQVNARFDEWVGPGSGKTVMGAIGITLGTDTVEISKDGTVKINGEEVGSGSYLGGKVVVTAGRSVQISEEEYSFRVDFQPSRYGDHLNIENIRSDNAAADGVLPSGLWGVTVDYDDDARNGDSGSGTQGGGAIETTEGEITNRGDRSTVETYEVGGLFDTDFEDHNQFGG